MIIFDNIIFSLQKVGGISVVWQQLINNIIQFNPKIEFIDYEKSRRNIFRKNLIIPNTYHIKYKKFYPIANQLVHPRIKLDSPFIFHSSYFRTCKNPNAINVTTIHDFIYEQGIPNIKQKFRMKLNYRAIRNSDAIICISENTKRDLFKFLPDIDPKKVHVIYNGVSDDYTIIESAKKYTQYDNYILFVGGRNGYKNFDFVINSLKDTNYNLLICGNPLSKSEVNVLEQILPNRFVNIVYPSNEELNRIYNSVYALVYPSSYEGFGIPILEAQRAGCPVIAFNASSIPEVIGNTPLLMKSLSKNELIEKLDLLNCDGLREKVVEDGLRNSRNFSWRKMAKEYFNLYNKLLEKRNNK